MKSLLMIIPARKGSKRLPNKNMRLMAGKPMLQWTLDAAAKARSILKADGVDARVMLTTDYSLDELLSILPAGVWSANRHPHLCRDETPMHEVVRDAIYAAHMFYHQRFDSIMLLQPTSPTRTADDIVCLAQDRNREWFTSENTEPNGSMYKFTESFFLMSCFNDSWFTERSSVGRLNLNRLTPDVDTEKDFQLAESLLIKRQSIQPESCFAADLCDKCAGRLCPKRGGPA